MGKELVNYTITCMYCDKKENIILKRNTLHYYGYTYADGSKITSDSYPNGWKEYILDFKGVEVGNYTILSEYINFPNHIPQKMICEACYEIKDILE